jgi:hypothetical protein
MGGLENLHAPMCAATKDVFAVVEQHDQLPHQFTILEPADSAWLETLAAVYRDLRTVTDSPLIDLTLNGVQILDVASVKARLTSTQLPTRNASPRGTNFAVERSDLGEVAMALAGEQLRGYAYGYRSTRDRELVSLPGRGIDQIGIRSDFDSALEEHITLSLGEAKVSSQARNPPGVVDSAGDSMRNQHLGHISAVSATCAKLWGASRRCTDPEIQRLLQLAATLWEHKQFEYLVVKCTNMLVRPVHGSEADFGSFATSPNDFAPGEIDFMVLRIDTGDVEVVVDQFLQSARGTGGKQ